MLPNPYGWEDRILSGEIAYYSNIDYVRVYAGIFNRTAVCGDVQSGSAVWKKEFTRFSSFDPDKKM